MKTKHKACAIGMSALFALSLLAGCGGTTTPSEGSSGGDEGNGGGENNPPPVTSIIQSTVADEEAVAYLGLDEVEITDSYAANGLRKELDYLLLLDADRLLADFRANAKLPAVDGKTAYTSELNIGARWEGALIGGHTLGHYMTAIAQAYVNAGTPEADKHKLGERIDYIVDVLKSCQDNAETAGAKAGFLWGAMMLNSKNPEIQFDNVENGLTNIQTQAWVPWYTMHKILAGLIDLYQIAGNGTALDVATKLGDWVYNRVKDWDPAKQAKVLGIEYGGMNDALYNLYAITGNENHAVAAHKFDEESLFEAVLSGRQNYLDNKHANTTIPKILGALNGYIQMSKNPVAGIDTSDYLRVAQRFWTDVNGKHTYVTGGNSEWEHFGPDYVLDRERTNANCETCNTYNMLKLSRMLFTQQRNTQSLAAKNYLDFYENTYINAILSSQNPETGMTTYFQPMASGYFKVYSTPEGNFWCCTGSGMESFSKLNDSIYYTAGNATYVSLYFSSVLRTEKVALTQTADLENSDDVTIHIDSGATVLRLRRPNWTENFSVTVNGIGVELGEKDYFVSVDVKEGDTVAVHMEKSVTVHTLPDQSGDHPVYAFKYGPFVLSAELGTENMTTTTTGVGVTIPEAPVRVDPIEVKSTTEGGDAEAFLENINEYMVRGEDGKFTLNGAQKTYIFSYHYRQYHERYAIYLEVASSGTVEKVVEPYSWVRQDTVQPGYGQYETDELHTMQDNGSVGATNDGTYRYATAGGSFTYRMAVDKSTYNRLVIFLRGEDKGKTLKVSSGNTVLRSETLTGTAAEYEIVIELPASLVQSAETVSANGRSYDVIPLTFSGVNGAESARVCSYIYSERMENNTAYFVDCGDYTPATTSAGDYLGRYNSVTEQVYGADPVTGKMWGLLDTHAANIAGSPQVGMGFGTNSTWAFEFNAANSNLAKTASNRYTKNQYENGVARNLHYKFELEDGVYVVELYFADPWGVSASPNVSANDTQIITGAATGHAIQARVTVSGGSLTLDITTDSLCINICYILIMFAE